MGISESDELRAFEATGIYRLAESGGLECPELIGPITGGGGGGHIWYCSGGCCAGGRIMGSFMDGFGD